MKPVPSTPRPPRVTYSLQLSTPADGGEARRLRQLLKIALRAFNLRCTRVAPALDADAPVTT